MLRRARRRASLAENPATPVTVPSRRLKLPTRSLMLKLASVEDHAAVRAQGPANKTVPGSSAASSKRGAPLVAGGAGRPASEPWTIQPDESGSGTGETRQPGSRAAGQGAARRRSSAGSPAASQARMARWPRRSAEPRGKRPQARQLPPRRHQIVTRHAVEVDLHDLALKRV